MNWRILIPASLCILLLGACKKNETTTTKNYLEGSLTIQCINYIEIGQSVHFKTDHKLYHPGNGTLTYSWSINGLTDSSVPGQGPDNDFIYTFDKDNLATYTVTCTVSPSGDYYSTSATAYVTTIKGGIGINKDGKKYECSMPLKDYDTAKGDQLYTYSDDSTFVSTTLNGKEWMRCNLMADKARTSGTTGTPGREIGISYRDYDILDPVLGAYYNWDDAIDACPNGWHLPTDAEWTDMAKSVATAAGISEVPEREKDWEDVAGEMMCFYTFNGEEMQEYEPKVNKTDRSRLSIKTLGYAIGNASGSKYFKFFGEKAVYWTNTQCATDSDRAWCRFFSYDSPDVIAAPMDKKSFYAQIRCVKD